MSLPPFFFSSYISFLKEKINSESNELEKKQRKKRGHIQVRDIKDDNNKILPSNQRGNSCIDSNVDGRKKTERVRKTERATNSMLFIHFN